MIQSEKRYYLYHIRDSETSLGLGHDGYIGITQNLARRSRQHFEALRNGTHHNEKLQAAYNSAPQRQQLWLITSGSKEEVEARERLLVPKDDFLLNKQRGGGHSRGMSEEEALRRINANREEKASDGAEKEKSESKGQASGGGQNEKTGSTGMPQEEDKKSAGGAAAAGGAAILAAAESAAAAAAVIAGTAASGIGTAYMVNKHYLKDDEALPQEEREARQVGRAASYAGGGAGAAGAVAMVAMAGEAGLGGTAVASGLTAIGTGVGGGLGVGVFVTLAIPALGAVAVAGVCYGGVKLYKRWKS